MSWSESYVFTGPGSAALNLLRVLVSDTAEYLAGVDFGSDMRDAWCLYCASEEHRFVVPVPRQPSLDWYVEHKADCPIVRARTLIETEIAAGGRS